MASNVDIRGVPRGPCDCGQCQVYQKTNNGKSILEINSFVIDSCNSSIYLLTDFGVFSCMLTNRNRK